MRLDCQCDRPKDQRLVDGSLVCCYCRRWMLECEARYLLKMPLAQRRAELARRQPLREGAVETLKQTMQEIFMYKKKGGGKKK